MKLIPRPYRGIQDFRHLDAILTSTGKAAGNPYYAHPGDVRWWLFYIFPEDNLFQGLTLWEDESGCPAAWTLFSPPDAALDVYCRPDIHAGRELEYLVGWGVKRMAEILRQAGEPRLYKMWTHSDDQRLLSVLEGCGFTPADETIVVLTLAFDGPLPSTDLPPGYRVRSARGMAELESRAAAQHSAFDSPIPMDRYLQRLRRYLTSPVYNPDQEVVAEAPDGSIAAFARIWVDPITRCGYFEPVGTHSAHRRRGLGRAVMLEGLRRLQDQGMTMARVCTDAANEAAICLYISVGFHISLRLPTYVRDV